MTKEYPRRGGSRTIEQLEREMHGQQAAAASTLAGADMTAPKEPAPKPGDKAHDKTAPKT